MRPTLTLRIFLFWLTQQSRRRGIAPRTIVLDEIPPIPAPQPSVDVLRQIRRVTGRPSFPVRLSSLRIRRWREIRVPGGEGERTARLYRPRGKVRGVVLFLHGGGFVHCDLVSHHGICCRLAASSGAMVLSLDYRLLGLGFQGGAEGCGNGDTPLGIETVLMRAEEHAHERCASFLHSEPGIRLLIIWLGLHWDIMGFHGTSNRYRQKTAENCDIFES